MDRLHEILKSVSEAAQDNLKGAIVPTPVVIVDAPADEPKPVIKPELVDQDLKTEQEKLANDKLKKKDSVTSIADDSSEAEDSDEYKTELYEMSLSSLRAISTHTQAILNAIDTNDVMVKENLTEPWLQGRIAITEDYLRTIHDFLIFSQEVDDTETVSKQGLWDNIRQKKDREGKDYKPAKPGDKDRPDPKMWKRLTKEDKKK